MIARRFECLVVNNGGGVNSFGMLAGMFERGMQHQVDLVSTADTGGEKPETYAALDELDIWLLRNGFHHIRRVKNSGMYVTLENNCLAKHMLPSIAYGFKSCSDKYKIRPQDQYVKTWPVAQRVWASGGVVTRAIGYDTGEPHRAKVYDGNGYQFWYPLIEWGWDRAACIAAIKRVGLTVPPKSACFYCPSSKKGEVLALKRDHPDLFDRAISMENNAHLTSVKGLGRHWSWSDLAKADEDQFKLFAEPPEIPCICGDGSDDEGIA